MRRIATGSVKETAAAEFVHRNTVINRAAAFRTATGLDVSIPLQAAVALLGLGRHPGVPVQPSTP